jgi:hypothetical protein
MVDVKLSADIAGEMAAYNDRARSETAMISPGFMSPGPASQDLSPSPPGSTEMNTRHGTGLTVPDEKMSAREFRRRSRRLGWFEKLRDSLQKEENIGWYVVVCGDDARTEGVENMAPNADYDQYSSTEGEDTEKEIEPPLRVPRSAGLKGFFRRDKDRESRSGGSLK